MKKKMMLLVIVLTLGVCSIGVVAAGQGTGNGGDGIILPDYDFFKSSHKHYIKLVRRGEKKAPTRVYLLDFAEMGIQDKASLKFRELPILNSQEIFIGKSFTHYNINNPSLFRELMQYDGFFGKSTKCNITCFPTLETEKFATTPRLKDLFSRYVIAIEQGDREEERFTDYLVKGIMEGLAKSSILDRSALLTEQQLQSREERRSAYKVFAKEAAKVHKHLQRDIYDDDTLVAVGIINKIEQIRQVIPEFAQILQEKIIELDWILLNDQLVREVYDEGASPLVYESKVQIAYRDNEMVTIPSKYWSYSSRGLDTHNKIGLIFHEAIYDITAKQGDVDSRRARIINGYLFRSNTSTRFIKKAWSRMMEKNL